MNLNISMGVKVMLTILKKLFLQSGSGRQESALVRGLDTKARSYMSPVLEILEHEQITKLLKLDRRKVWVPNRAFYGRVFSILQAPTASNDSIVQDCAGL